MFYISNPEGLMKGTYNFQILGNETPIIVDLACGTGGGEGKRKREKRVCWNGRGF